MLLRSDHMGSFFPLPSSETRPYVVCCSLQMSRFKFLGEALLRDAFKHLGVRVLQGVTTAISYCCGSSHGRCTALLLSFHSC